MSKNAAKARVFVKFARAASADFADLLRHCADDEAILDLLPDDGHWDLPHRLDAAVEWLIDTGDAPDHTTAPDPWTTYRATILGHAAWVGEFVREQRVQTNEVQRCFALLPIFLALSATYRRPFRLIELGASAGLNLLWDRYRYRYHNGRWGTATASLELAGEERRTVPPDVLRTEVRISSRVGIDLNPLDVNDADDVRLLRAFAARHRRRRLMDAIATARGDPPPLIRGDYLRLLPDLLAERDDASPSSIRRCRRSTWERNRRRA